MGPLQLYQNQKNHQLDYVVLETKNPAIFGTIGAS